MATINKVTMTGTFQASVSSAGVGQSTIHVANASISITGNTNTTTKYVHYRITSGGTSIRQSYYILKKSTTSHKISITAANKVYNEKSGTVSIPIHLDVAVTSSATAPASSSTSWTTLRASSHSIPALSKSDFFFYEDEAHTKLYASILDVVEGEYFTAPDAIPSVSMTEWADQNGHTYTAGSTKCRNTYPTGTVIRIHPVRLAPKVKVKKDGVWIDGEIKCKVNGEWVTATSAYVKAEGEWVKIP